MSPLERVQVVVTGVVQGVGYRYFVVRKASRLSLTGWVRNTAHGAVEMVVEGEAGLLRDLVSELRIGPPSARVASVNVVSQQYLGEFQRFEVQF
jgi:acylphosphatase